jgi:hypothetical protein
MIKRIQLIAKCDELARSVEYYYGRNASSIQV